MPRYVHLVFIHISEALGIITEDIVGVQVAVWFLSGGNCGND